MTKRYRWLGVFLLLVTFFFSACGSGDEEPINSPIITEEKITYVDMKEVSLEPFHSYIRLVGTVQTSHDVKLSSQISGRIETYFVKRGDFVKKGANILKIDDRKITQQVNNLEASYLLANDSYSRVRKLYEGDNIGSEIDLLGAKYRMKQAQAAYKAAKVDWDNTIIISPFDAYIDYIYTEEGETIGIGTPVAHLLSPKDMYIDLDVPARYSSKVKIGKKVTYTYSSVTNEYFEGEIRFVSRHIDSKVRVFKVEITMPSDIEIFKVGAKVNIDMYIDSYDDVFVLDNEYIISNENRPYIFVPYMREDGTRVARKHYITLKTSFNGRSVISKGLTLGMEVITKGISYLQEGSRIEQVQ